MHVVFKIQGLICASLDPAGRTPSTILSQYFGKPVHLVMKGPKRRVCPPTHAFPDLEASSVFQDVYPFLVASEESLAEVGRVVRVRAVRATRTRADEPIDAYISSSAARAAVSLSYYQYVHKRREGTHSSSRTLIRSGACEKWHS